MIQQPAPQGQPIPAQPQGPPPVTIDAVVKLLRDDRMRGFRIDIETDSLVEADQTKEREAATELVAAIGAFFKEFGPVVAQMPPLAPMAGQLLQFAVRRFKVGSELEETIEKSMAQVAEHLANPAPPQPNPEDQAKLAITQQKGQAEISKAQLSVQEAQTKAQGEAALREQAARHAEAEDNRKAALHELDKEAKRIAHEHDMNQRTLEAARAQQLHELTVEKMHHEAGIKAQSAEHDASIRKDSASHEASIKKESASHAMSLKEKKASSKEKKTNGDGETKANLEKLMANISKAVTSPKKVTRDAKGDMIIAHIDNKGD